MKQIITHFTDNDLYTFSCQYYIMQKYPRAEVEYTFFDRNRTVYPVGFAELVQEQVNYMRDVVITDEEIDFMTNRCVWLPLWYFTFLRGYRFNPDEVTISQDNEGHLHIGIKGKWFSTIMWEMPILSCISELYHRLNGDMDSYNPETERQRVIEKSKKIFEAGLVLGDMGTRRRFSFEHQWLVISTMTEVYRQGPSSLSGSVRGSSATTLVQEPSAQTCSLARARTLTHDSWPGIFTGTSNVWMAMKLGLKPLGTMSHQIISFEENVSGIFEANFNVMKKFSDVYDGDNGIYLYDCFGDKLFFNNLSKRMAMMYSGFRVDSGNEEEQVDKIVEKYKSLGIDPRTKQVVFSNGLDIDRAIEIHNYCQGKVIPSFGVGTNLTCDVVGVKPSNIVVKLTKCRITELREWHDCIKLSCDKGKILGSKVKCDYIQELINNGQK